VREARFLLLMVVCAGSSVAFADPFAGYLYPAGMQAGTTVQVIVGGQGLGGVDRGWVSGEGVRIVRVEQVPAFTRAPGDGQRQWLEKWLRNLEDGVTAMPPLPKDKVLRNWPRNRWWETLDKLDALSLSLVAREHFSPRPDPLQAAPAIAERLILTVVADKTAEPGLRELLLFNGNAACAPRPFFLSSEPHVAEPLYAPPPRKGRKPVRREPPVCRTPVVLDGQVLPGETDVFRLALNGGERLLCLVTGRELVPYLGDAVPGFFNPVLRLTDDDGRELAFADDFHYLPDPVLTCQIEKTGTYRLEVRDNLYRGRDDFVYSVSCLTDGRRVPTPQERAFVCRPKPVVRGSFEGTVSYPHGAASFDFEVRKPGALTFDLAARRIGSPLDAVLRLYGPITGWLRKDGPLLATWDDVTNGLYVGGIPQAECDPKGTWSFETPGTYRVVVEDRVGGGGEAYRFSLDIAPAWPAFEVYALKSSLVLRPGRDARTSFRVKAVRTNGFVGDIVLWGKEDLSVVRGIIPAGNDEAEIVVKTAGADWRGVRKTGLAASAETQAGLTLERPVMPGNEVEQAFAYTHILPASDFFVIRPGGPDFPKGPPAWIDMPYDGFLPRRIIHASVDFASFKSDYVLGLEASATADVSVVRAPATADEAVLAAKFASSAAVFRKRNLGVFALEPQAGDDPGAAARAVLAGCIGMVTPKLDYAAGDERRVRAFARAMEQTADNDVLVYVPSGAGNPLKGPAGVAVRRLRDAGWCFDFVSDKTMAAALRSWNHRTLFVPKGLGPLSEETRKLLDEAEAKGRRLNVVDGGADPKEIACQFAKTSRREELPKGLRFARFGRCWGEGWYFVHNPTAAKVSGAVRFNIRGAALSAFRMDVRTGAVEPLPKAKGGKFTLALEAGGSAWIRASR